MFINQRNNFLLAEKLLTEFEGYRNDIYKDTLGNHTVGIGHEITERESEVLNRDLPKKVGWIIEDYEVRELFILDIKKAIKVATDIFGSEFYDNTEEDTKLFLVLMSFNMGYKLRTFKKANAHLLSGNNFKARIEYLDSLWVKQVHMNRALKTTDLLIKKNHE